jgi:hypothetical protein
MDLLFVGPVDLSISHGFPCRAAPAGPERHRSRGGRRGEVRQVVGIPAEAPEAVQKALDGSARMITTGRDRVFLLNGYRNATASYADLRVKY